MMKILTMTTLFLLVLAAFSCKSSAKHSDGDATAIELNDGERWVVNGEMTPHILDGEKILKDYDNSDYKILASQLETKNTSLIKSCTMDGKSHDELHKWLHPHMGLIEDLGKANNEEEAQKIIDQLNASFKTYNTYFQ